ncbi:hypothetical protein Tco_0619791, partial [Tanacetum coccineum]
MDGRWSRYGVITGKFINMVVFHGGSMVVSGGLKGCLDHWIQGSSSLLPSLQSDLE